MKKISLLLAGLAALGLLACGGTRPTYLGVIDQRLAPCPASPNCIASDAIDPDRDIEPFTLEVGPDEGWVATVEAVRALPRTEIVRSTNHYLHAECTSAMFRYVDDLELHLRPGDGVIAVRSASRLGHSDFGVNRRRVERLRETLVEAGVIE